MTLCLLFLTLQISKEAKECVQECVSEFISFITSEYPFVKSISVLICHRGNEGDFLRAPCLVVVLVPL